MKTQKSISTIALLLTTGIGALMLTNDAYAHCDTMNGPVVQDARRAIETNDVTPVLKWVTEADESEVKAAFDRTLAVRASGDAAQELADLYFFETLVRLHRMSEGVGYTGLKPATAVAPEIAAADHALETGSVESLANLLTRDLHAALEARFQKAYAARAHAEHNVDAGRAFVAAYVRFTHLAEAIGETTRHAGEENGEAAGEGHAH